VVGDHDGIRLDQFVVRRWRGVGRRLARLAIAAGAVTVNGRRARKGQRLQSGDVVRADPGLLARTPAAQPDLAVPVLHEDAALVAVEKPAGMPALALRPSDRDTVANYLLGRYPEVGASAASAMEAGLVHRLDTGTSGVLVAARSAPAWQTLRAQFRERRVDKLYLAVVAGTVRHRGIIDTPIAHRPGRPREMETCADAARARMLRARPALTSYRPLRRLRGATLLAVRIATGMRHQIRVHLASIGHPVLGDALYGDDDSRRAASRLLLHAARIAFAHPSDGRRVIIRSRLPFDFEAALRDRGVG
jgi:23S rRNA pseudouridine1911/1915/1917 synthase